MKRKKKQTDSQNLKVAFFFCFFVFSLILISVIAKMFFLIKQSHFDGVHNFIVAIEDKNILNKQGKRVMELISFAPDANSISILKLYINSSSEKEKDFKVGKFLKIPIDSDIKFKVSNEESFKFNQIIELPKNEKDVVLKIQSIVLNYKDMETNSTLVDFGRVLLFTKTVPLHAITYKELTVTSDQTDAAEDLSIDKLSSQLFVDSTISQEKVTIAIVNGTGVLGLGNRLARLITNIGGNVVSVSTADKIIDQSEISYLDKKTYTLERLSKILGYEINKKEAQTISDITITLGKDSLSHLIF